MYEPQLQGIMNKLFVWEKSILHGIIRIPAEAAAPDNEVRYC